MLLLVVTLIGLLVIIFVVMILVFRRVMARNITSATSHMDQLHEEYTRKEEAAESRLAEAQTQAQEIVQKAEQEAQATGTAMLRQAEEEKEALIQQARTQAQEIVEQAQKSRQQLLSEVEMRIEKQARAMACTLVADSLPDDCKKVVHERWVADLLEGGFQNVDRLKIPEDAQEVQVVSAFELPESDRKKVSAQLESVLGRRFTIAVTVDPTLIAGVMVTIGSLVLDGSLKYTIQEKAR